MAQLADRRGLLDGVVVSGGEPTLQPDLPRVCAHLQAMGFAVKLDTNGSRPAVLHALLADQLDDYVAMDVKAPRRSTPRSLAWPPTSRRSERAFCSCPPAASRTSSGRRWSNPC